MNGRSLYSRKPLRHIAVALAVCALATSVSAQSGPQWAASAYRLRVLVLFDLPPTSEQLLSSTLPRHLQQRTTASIGALWNLDIVVPDPSESHQIRQSIEDVPAEILASLAENCDKLVLLDISSEGSGYLLRCRVYDAFVQRWAASLDGEVATIAEIPETAFWMLRETFAPVAYFQSDPEDDQRVTLAWKGSALPGKANANSWISAGDILVPIVRRVDRDGKAIEDGVEQVDWTFFEVGDDGKAASARLWSHTKRPFGVRRRGNIDHNAILARGSLEPVTVRTESRITENLPLAGLDIYRQIPGQESTTPVGKTNLQGEVQVTPGQHLLEMIYIKSGSQVLAKLPISFSTDQVVSVPLVDDPARLEAEAKINAVREELIDLVARRMILASRVRKQIKAGESKQAESLLRQLEELPGRAQFDQMLAKQEQVSRSDNPMVQKRIDKLFADTRVVLGHFLDAKLATELRTELAQAKK